MYLRVVRLFYRALEHIRFKLEALNKQIYDKYFLQKTNYEVAVSTLGLYCITRTIRTGRHTEEKSYLYVREGDVFHFKDCPLEKFIIVNGEYIKYAANEREGV